MIVRFRTHFWMQCLLGWFSFVRDEKDLYLWIYLMLDFGAGEAEKVILVQPLPKVTSAKHCWYA